jgi:hypothetical protein
MEQGQPLVEPPRIKKPVRISRSHRDLVLVTAALSRGAGPPSFFVKKATAAHGALPARRTPPSVGRQTRLGSLVAVRGGYGLRTGI